MATLKAPRATLKSARKHLTDLKQAVRDLGQFKANVVSVKPHPTVRNVARYHFENPLEQISAEAGTVAGNLRAVLDQIIFALIELRTGQEPSPKHKSQFPICKCPKDFRARIKPDLEGLWFQDVALIERLQPYNGGQWIARLKELAEMHKHRKQIYLVSKLLTTPIQQNIPIGEFKANPDAFVLLPNATIPVPKAVDVHGRFTDTVTLADGSPIVDTLEILQAEIASVVDLFQPPFN